MDIGTHRTLLAEYGDPHTWWCGSHCPHAGWACPEEYDDDSDYDDDRASLWVEWVGRPSTLYALPPLTFPLLVAP